MNSIKLLMLLLSISISTVTSSPVTATPLAAVLQAPPTANTQCDVTNTCTNPLAATNCYCDVMCAYYDDCCHDYVPEVFDTATLKLPARAVVTCQKLPELDDTREDGELYLVTKCPRGYSDVNIRRHCEEVSRNAADRFDTIPVSNRTARVTLLYRNVYCALCNGQLTVLFWSVKLHCTSTKHRQLPSTYTLHSYTQLGDCNTVTFSVPSLQLQPRYCKSNIARCDRNWADVSVMTRCRQHVSYVYAGTRTFRNKFCALCNYVNETYISCKDHRRTTFTSSEKQNIAPLTVTFDFNSAHVTSQLGNMENDVAFPACPQGQLYDPFSDACRLLYTGTTGDVTADVTEVIKEPVNELGLNCSDVTADVLAVNSSSVQVVRLDDRSVFVPSLQRTFRPAEYHVTNNNNLYYICVHTTTTTTTTTSTTTTSTSEYCFNVLPSVSSTHYVVSMLGAVICLGALAMTVISCLVLPSLRSATPAKCEILLTICLLLTQVIYLITGPLSTFSSTTEQICFYLAVTFQYCVLSSFFWLNVLAIRSFLSLDQYNSTRTFSFTQCNLYAWSAPVICVSACLAISFLHIDGSYPLQSGTQCWELGLSQLLLYILPVVFVLVLNIVLFVCCSYRLRVAVFVCNSVRTDLAVAVQLTVIVTVQTVFQLLAAVLTESSLVANIYTVVNALLGPLVCMTLIGRRFLCPTENVVYHRPAARPTERK